MNANAQTNRMAGWEQAWFERLPRIDEQIAHFAREEGGLGADNLQRLCDSVRLWFDQEIPHLGYDIDWQRAKSDAHMLQELLDRRFIMLLHEGRLRLCPQESPVVEE